MPTQQEPYALAHDDGQALWFLGNVLTRVKATGEQTGGAYGLIDQVIPAGFASPWHVHHAEDDCCESVTQQALAAVSAIGVPVKRMNDTSGFLRRICI